MDDDVPEYQTPDDNMSLGQPQHKIAAAATFKLNHELYVTPSATYYSDRWALSPTSSSGYAKTSDRILVNLTVIKKNFLGVDGLDASASIHNIFDEEYDYIQPIVFETQFPGPSREFYFKLTYNF